jgi:hypothetical protein
MKRSTEDWTSSQAVIAVLIIWVATGIIISIVLFLFIVLGGFDKRLLVAKIELQDTKSKVQHLENLIAILSRQWYEHEIHNCCRTQIRSGFVSTLNINKHRQAIVYASTPIGE